VKTRENSRLLKKKITPPPPSKILIKFVCCERKKKNPPLPLSRLVFGISISRKKPTYIHYY
jgi:hypothetical protein